MKRDQRRRSAFALLVLAWAFWLPHWGPAVLVVTAVAWMALHNRVEAGFGEALRRQWQRGWPPAPLTLIALLGVSGMAFMLADAPTTAKVMPIGLDALGLSVILFGHWWSLVALPTWLGGAPTRRGEIEFGRRTTDSGIRRS